MHDIQEVLRPSNVGRTNKQRKKDHRKPGPVSDQEPAKLSAKVVPIAEPGQSTKQKRTAASENVGAEETAAKPPVQITATAFNIDRNESLYEVTYTDLDGRFRKRRIGRELFQDPKKVVDILVKAHAALPDDRASAVALVNKAVLSKDSRKYQVTGRSGWYDDKTFIYPTATYGKLAKELYWDGSNDIDPALGQCNGTLKAWRAGVQEAAEFSDYVIFASSVPLASALLDVIDEDEGAVFHLHGINAYKGTREKAKSSSGKSLVARVAASITGRCKKNDLVTFAATARSIEDYCCAHNHLGAAFDEEGRALNSGSGPRIKADELPYLVASGRGGLRSRKAMRDPDLENLTWALLQYRRARTRSTILSVAPHARKGPRCA